MNRLLVVQLAFLLAAAALGCGSVRLPTGPDARGTPPWILDAVGAPDRSEEDRRLDARRRPSELLALVGIGPGQRVAELGAGVGYTAELLARAVGPAGVVYAQNSPWILARSAERPWTQRLNKGVMKNVVRLDRAFDDPFPPDVRELDAVLCVLFYHDLFWLGVDRMKMLRSVHGALRSGGVFAVVDHSARPGTAATEAQSLHRIEERVVRSELEQAGFRFRTAGTFLRNAADSRDWNAAPMAAGDRRGTNDQFVLVYEKR